MSTFSPNFLTLNSQQNKNLSIVLSIDTCPYKFSNRKIYRDQYHVLGEPDSVLDSVSYVLGEKFYGQDTAVLDILSLDNSSLTIQQRLEPEQGRGSVSTITFSLIDKNGIVTQIISSGVILDEILGKAVEMKIGYSEITYPTDYYVIFRGLITSVESRSGLVVFQTSDANVKRRQNIFYCAATKLSAGIDDSVTTIPVVSTADFFDHVLGPDGTYDTAIKTYIRIDDEFMLYPASTGITDETSFEVSGRGSEPTGIPGWNVVTNAAAAHDADADVYAYIWIEDHAIDMALKLMMSGWGTYCLTDLDIESFVIMPDGSANYQAIVFPEGVDIKRDYGIAEGDYITVTGASEVDNNITLRQILTINDWDTENTNRYLTVTGAALIPETYTSALMSVRSQYDTYPDGCGLKLLPNEVDVEGHQTLKNAYLSDSGNSYRFFISSQESGKTFLEDEIYLPISAYSFTKQGRLSAKVTTPPIANATIQQVDKTNIINPKNISIQRATNNRTFFNEIDFSYDEDINGNFTSISNFVDTDSLNTIFLSTLPISSRGLRSDLTTSSSLIINRRANFLLGRYGYGASRLVVDSTFGTGCQIEAGDVIIVDGTDLNISNLNNGTRAFGKQMFEVIDRSLNFATGVTPLTLVSGVGAGVGSRYAVISPSSLIGTGSTTTKLVIVESFTANDPVYPYNEPRKWQNFIGKVIAVHDKTYATYETTIFTGFNPGNSHEMLVSPALSSAPTAEMIIDIPTYTTDDLYRLMFAHMSPVATVQSGTSVTEFELDAPGAAKVLADSIIRVHNADFTNDSGDVYVDSVVGTTITTKTTMGFTPSNGDICSIMGFLDSGGAYRWI